MNSRLGTIFRVAVHVGALIPLAILVWRYLAGNLTANPIEAVQIDSGRVGLNLLFLSLACTPVYLLTGFKPVMLARRVLGLYAFMYIGLHLANYVAIDYGFNLALIRDDALLAKRFILAGLAAFLLLLPLAVFSFSKLRKIMGLNRNIFRWFSYAAAVLVVIHFIWQTKVDDALPFVYGGILLLLLAFRIPYVNNRLKRRHKRREDENTTPT